MDWAAIEGLVYSEEKHPKAIMAPRTVKDGTLYQCYLPGAEEVQLIEQKSGKMQRMDLQEESGYYARDMSGTLLMVLSFFVMYSA